MNDETILVSSTKSFKVRQHDSSNTILLTSMNNLKQKLDKNDKNKDNENENENDGDILNLNNTNNNESIYSAISCVYTLEQQPPRLNKLYQILYQRPYSYVYIYIY